MNFAFQVHCFCNKIQSDVEGQFDSTYYGRRWRNGERSIGLNDAVVLPKVELSDLVRETANNHALFRMGSVKTHSCLNSANFLRSFIFVPGSIKWKILLDEYFDNYQS